MNGALGAAVLTWAARCVRESFVMFWETLWPLVLGFGLSGAVQSFVAPTDLERTLGDHRPRAVARAAGYGMASSSCSFAATAMAKSLFAKGADFISALVFMFASTNLVMELGIVLLVLLGWQFTVAEFVGGAIMIVLLVPTAAFALPAGSIAGARARVTSARGNALTAAPSTEAAASWHARIRTRSGWSEAARYAMADLKMLRRELVIGYVVAGVLSVAVPSRWWGFLFLHGHGSITTVENAIVGPMIAFASFVCSIGNVPLAAALWKGGITFGGVISFIFADLVAAPLVLIYRRYYGSALATRLVLVFWFVMSAAGLLVQTLFSAARAVPARAPARLIAAGVHWDYTTGLNLVFLGVFAGLWALARAAGEVADSTYATDPVCGMQVRRRQAPARRETGLQSVYFCSERCADKYGEAEAHRGGEGASP